MNVLRMKIPNNAVQGNMQMEEEVKEQVRLEMRLTILGYQILLYRDCSMICSGLKYFVE